MFVDRREAASASRPRHCAWSPGMRLDRPLAVNDAPACDVPFPEYRAACCGQDVEDDQTAKGVQQARRKQLARPKLVAVRPSGLLTVRLSE